MRENIFRLIFLLLFPVFSPTAILKITVDAAIHPVTSEYIRDAIDRADNENASLLIMTLNTAGEKVRIVEVLETLKIKARKA